MRKKELKIENNNNNNNAAVCRVIFLDCPGECLKDRICGRRLDPVSGERYVYYY